MEEGFGRDLQFIGISFTLAMQEGQTEHALKCSTLTPTGVSMAQLLLA